ncbi:MAG: N-acetylmuramoyl-L-alanine amidase [Spirochaetaceae bacterium]|jgi:N-acetylmuramoyl-L-alanine amidase|nr:N-acetylmuramoyl-L-alanine amidase [Spirochaetaceae bacterium]
MHNRRFLIGLVFSSLLLLSAQIVGFGDERVLTLDETLKNLGSSGDEVTFRWDPFFQAGVFSWAEQYVSFRVGTLGETGLVIRNGKEILSLPTPYLEQGTLHFPLAFVNALDKALEETLAQEAPVQFRIAAIVVDPGHGGKDTGAVGNHTIKGKPVRVQEKDLVLKISKDLHSRLSRSFPDKQVLLTRDKDTFISLDDRVAIANGIPLKDNEATVFISIHANASFNKHVRGYEVWYLNPEYRRTLIDQSKYKDVQEVIPILNAMLEEEFTSESIRMAESILKRFDETLGGDFPSRGIKEEEWFVVRNARMPSVLVELGFLSNETDVTLLTDDAYLQHFSEALHKGIMDFVSEFEGL